MWTSLQSRNSTAQFIFFGKSASKEKQVPWHQRTNNKAAYKLLYMSLEATLHYSTLLALSTLEYKWGAGRRGTVGRRTALSRAPAGSPCVIL